MISSLVGCRVTLNHPSVGDKVGHDMIIVSQYLIDGKVQFILVDEFGILWEHVPVDYFAVALDTLPFNVSDNHEEEASGATEVQEQTTGGDDHAGGETYPED